MGDRHAERQAALVLWQDHFIIDIFYQCIKIEKPMQTIDISNIDLKSLRILVAVAEGKSMSEVAAELNVNQSTISHTIDRLRKELRDPLFYRQGRSVQPTEFLLGSLRQIRSLVLALEALPKRADFNPVNFSGEIVIATRVSEMMSILAPFKKLVHAQAPYAQIRLLDLGPRQQAESILETSTADIVIATRSSKISYALNSAELFKDKFLVFYDETARGPIRNLDDYLEARHAVLDFGGENGSMIDRYLDARGLSRRVILGAPNVLNLAELAKGTDTILTMHSRMKNSLLKEFSTCEDPLSLPEFTYDALWHKRRDHDPKIAWARDRLIEIAQTAFQTPIA